jgi:hypothetical protein
LSKKQRQEKGENPFVKSKGTQQEKKAHACGSDEKDKNVFRN